MPPPETLADINRPLTSRIDRIRIDAGFSVADMARWLDAPQGTVRTWCRGERTPKDHKVAQIEERLGWLEHAVKNKIGVSLPIPLNLTQSNRIAYVNSLRAHYEPRARGQ